MITAFINVYARARPAMVEVKCASEVGLGVSFSFYHI